MANVIFDSGSSGTQGYGGTITHSHTIGSGANRVLYAQCTIPSTSDKVSGVTYGGVAMERISRFSFASESNVAYTYRLINPPTGTADVVWSFTSNDVAAVAVAHSWSNAHQTTPNGTVGGEVSVGNGPHTVNLTSGGAEAVAVSFIGSNTAGENTQFIHGTDQITIANMTNGGSATNSGTVAAAASYKLNTTSMSEGWNGAGYRNFVHVAFQINPATTGGGGGGATAITLSGPSSGTVGSASTNFTAGADGTISGTVVVTPSDGGAGGTFTPTSVSISSGTPTGTFTYTAASSGAKTISVTNNGGLSNPSNITYTASASGATAVTLTGPTSGTAGSASSNFTVAANGAITGTVVVTPSDGGAGGTFLPTSVSISSGAPSGTFTYTAGSAGAKTISVTNNGGLSNPSSITYTAASAGGGTGTFTTYQWTSSGTLRANQAFTGTWYSGGAPGSAGGTATLVSGTLSPTGTATFTAPLGAGFLIGATADGGRYYQEGTVA